MDTKLNKESKATIELMIADGIITRENAEKYFPELKESEDERIRRMLKYFINGTAKSELEMSGLIKQDVLTWLDNIQQKEWSEEDEYCYKAILNHLVDEGNSATLNINRTRWRKLSDWLMAFKDRTPPRWKPKLEQKEVLKKLILYSSSHNIDEKSSLILKSLYEDLIYL